jgi:hypothetical protein
LHEKSTIIDSHNFSVTFESSPLELKNEKWRGTVRDDKEEVALRLLRNYFVDGQMFLYDVDGSARIVMWKNNWCMQIKRIWYSSMFIRLSHGKIAHRSGLRCFNEFAPGAAYLDKSSCYEVKDFYHDWYIDLTKLDAVQGTKAAVYATRKQRFVLGYVENTDDPENASNQHFFLGQVMDEPTNSILHGRFSGSAPSHYGIFTAARIWEGQT